MEGESGLGSEGSLGILIGVMLTVRRETGERGAPGVWWEGRTEGASCAVAAGEAGVEVELVL